MTIEILITGFLLAGFYCTLFALALSGIYSIFRNLK